MAGGDFLTFDQSGDFLESKIVTFNSGAKMDGSDDSFLLKLFFVGRDERSFVNYGLGRFNGTYVFENFVINAKDR